MLHASISASILLMYFGYRLMESGVLNQALGGIIAVVVGGLLGLISVVISYHIQNEQRLANRSLHKKVFMGDGTFAVSKMNTVR